MFYFLVDFLLLFFQRGWEPLFVKHFKHNTVDPKCFQGSQKKKKMEKKIIETVKVLAAVIEAHGYTQH